MFISFFIKSKKTMVKAILQSHFVKIYLSKQIIKLIERSKIKIK